MIHWDWVFTLLLALLLFKLFEVVFSSIWIATAEFLYPYARNFTKQMVAVNLPSASQLVDEMLPDLGKPIGYIVEEQILPEHDAPPVVASQGPRCTMNLNSCGVAYCEWPRCTEPTLR